MSISRHLIEQFVEALIAEEVYDEEEGVWKFADGRQCSVCFDSADRIAHEFSGKVVGYWSNDNPTATIGGGLCAGHDFAFIEDRWIVDYWAFRVAGIIPKPVIDLNLAEDKMLSARLFGDRDAWEDITI